MKRFAVVGSPIEHSLSPLLHQTAFRSLGLDWYYERCEVQAGELESFLAGQDFAGLSVTMPLKDEAFKVATSHDQLALQTRVVNTLVCSASGYAGYNTDVLGFRAALDARGLSSIPTALVIGSGATARSAIAALRERTQSILVMARRDQLDLQNIDGRLQWGAALEADLVISTVPAPATASLQGGHGTLFDVIYAPWPTPLARLWSGPVISGLELLLHQAAYQSQLFVAPLECNLDQVRAAMREALDSPLLTN